MGFFLSVSGILVVPVVQTKVAPIVMYTKSVEIGVPDDEVSVRISKARVGFTITWGVLVAGIKKWERD